MKAVALGVGGGGVVREGPWRKKGLKRESLEQERLGNGECSRRTGRLAETNMKQEVLTGQRVNEKTLKSKGAVSKATSWCSR